MKLDIRNLDRIPADFCIFYCWQDHLDRKLHRFLIRDALTSAIKRVQDLLPDGSNCVLRIDSDTANRAGAVDIANTILEKIAASTMVIGDVTPVFVDKGKALYYPNPNVMLEMGYAARALGWGRVIGVFNGADCDVESLPFDIRHRRMSPYKCTDKSGRAQAEKDLEAVLVIAVCAVIQEIDRGVFDETLGSAKIKRERDVRLLRDVLNNLYRPYLDKFVEHGLRDSYFDDAQFFWISFDTIVCANNFRFYDNELERLIDDLWRIWRLVEHLSGRLFYPTGIPGQFRFKEHHLWGDTYGQDVEKLQKAFQEYPVKLKSFLDYVHDHYIEIDMAETDRKAWETNRPYICGDIFKETKDAEPTQESKKS